MPIIRQLPAAVVNKIAAGEVIERPASVVKELLENSVDAGATRVEVTMQGGGLEMIRVADNGCGMSPDQLFLAVASHATSKIESAEDLFHIGTLGFRGEALASIAEVSHFRLRSRTAAADSGAQLEVNGGQHGPVEPCGCDVGTTIEVRDLFYNTPVRRKFLRAAATEVSYSTEAFTRICLAYPHVRFVMRNNDRVLYDLPPTENWGERIATLMGRDVGAALMTVDGEEGGIRVSGYVADPNYSRGNNRWQYLFLNGRCIRDRSLQHALVEAYRGLLMTGRFPVAFLRLDMPVDLVDVNVHPTKMEVRFQDAGRLYSQILGTLRRKFLSSDLTARVRPDIRGPVASGQVTAGQGGSPPSMPQAPSPHYSIPTTVPPSPDGTRQQHRQDLLNWARGSSLGPSANPPLAVGGGPVSATGAERNANSPAFARGQSFGQPLGPALSASNSPASNSPEPWDVDEANLALARSVEGATHEELSGETASTPAPVAAPWRQPIGLQLHQRYLVTEDEEGILIIDQHALHERVLYEQLRVKADNRRMETQRLLVPEPVEFTGAELAMVLESRESLAAVGITVEPFGGDCVVVTSYPAILSRIRPAELLRQLVDALMEGKKGLERRDLLDELLHMVACKGAVKAGDPLAPEEVSELLAQRHLFRDTHHCPHGRPTALAFSKEELDRRFKRV